MRFGTITTAPCENVLPAVDARCNDPAYALAHPDLCPAGLGQRLIIKPSFAISCQLGSTQFKAVLVQDGIETDVTATATFTSSDASIALVGVKSGNATGIAAGIVQITAHYQDKTAQAELSIMGCTGQQCDATVAMLLLIDTSRSMGQAFSGAYSTKLAFARTAASNFAATINTHKDLVGAMTFNANGHTLLDSPTSNAALVASDIDGIAQTQQLTTFRDALDAAIDELNAVTADLKVIVIVSDGEDTTAAYTEDNNPLISTNNFKAAGGVIMALGVRAHGAGFNLLEAMVTGGFFINSYSTTQDDAIAFIKGLRGYICAGNCTPAGDEIEHRGTNNWTGFINWDVTQGLVDILGNGFYDILPGNGLYVDLRGSPILNPDFDIGILLSKIPFSIVSGHTYRVTLDLAGNNAVDRPDTVLVRVLSDSAVVLLSQTISIPDYTQGLHSYGYSFVAPANMDVRIEISQSNDTGTDLSETQAGVLLNRVQFDDMTDLINLLDDDFDDENPVYVPPACGIASVYYGGRYAIGYNCYGEGCLDTPPPVQLADPVPLPDIEAGFTPPVVYDATKTECATCGSNMNLSTVNLIPVMTGPTSPSGTASASDENPDFQAYGAFDGTKPATAPANNTVWELDSPSFPVWLRYTFPSAQTVRHYEICCSNATSVLGFGHAPKSWIFQGSNDGSTWTDLDTVTDAVFFLGETKKYLVDSPASFTSYRLYITDGVATDVTVFELAMFAAADQSICKTASAESTISQGAANAAASAAALALAQAALTCARVYTSTQQYTAHCSFGLFPVTRSATATSLNSQAEADALATAAAKVLADAALDCEHSNNDQQISITDYPGIAVPYPSVKNVSGFIGTVALVTVSLTKLNQFFPVDIVCVLQAPNGTAVVLFAKAGNAPAVNVSMTIADAGATVAPAGGPLVNGATYKPGHNGAYLALPAPGPAQPHQTTLASLIGSNPNGLWALWIMDTVFGQGTGTLDSWDLTIS